MISCRPPSHHGYWQSLFWERSNPREPKYSQYLSREEIADILSPGGHREQLVRDWLQSQGFSAEQITGVETKDVIYLNALVGQVEEAFGVHYEVFQHVGPRARQLWRSPVPFSIPLAMKDHIQMIHGIHDFPPLRKLLSCLQKLAFSPNLR